MAHEALAPQQLKKMPVLAALGVLSKAIGSAIAALQAVYPELYLDEDDLEPSSWAEPGLLAAAERIVDRAEAVGWAVNWYCSEILPKPPAPSPFDR